MLKKIAIILSVGLTHFGLGMGIILVARTWSTGDAFGYQPPPTSFRLLVEVTRIFHFPVISLGLYSRQWFPGDWIFIPVAVNSLLWGYGIYLLICLMRWIKNKIS